VATWSTIDVPTSVAGGTVLNTIAHSTMGSLVVGNYDTGPLTGHAFIYDFTANPLNPDHAYIKMTPVEAASITAYGIWDNANGTYTIAGGYSQILNGSASGAYLVDYTPGAAVGEEYSNFTTFEYANNDADQIITHFNGIVATEDGFNLTGDHVTAEDEQQLGFFASVKRNGDGTFATPVWTSINFPGAPVTSGNTVYDETVLGVYTGTDGSSSYIATVPEPSSAALLAISGLGTLLFFRRRSLITKP